MKSVKRLFMSLLLMVSMMGVFGVTASAAVPKEVRMVSVNEKLTVSGAAKVVSSKKTVATTKKMSGLKWKVTAKRAGQTTLTMYNSKNKAVMKVYLLVQPKGYPSYDTKGLKLKIGQSARVKAKASKLCTVKYTSSNNKIASVSKNGLILGKKEGRVTIKVKIIYKKKIMKTYTKIVTVTKKSSSSTKPTNPTPTNPKPDVSDTPETDEPQTETEKKPEPVPVPQPKPQPTLDSITCEISQTVFTVGDVVDPDIVTMMGIYSDQTTKLLLDFTIDLDTTTAGKKNLTVTHLGSGKVFTFVVTVEPKAPVLEGITCEISKTTFTVGDKVDPSIVTMVGNYSDGSY